MMKSFIKYIEYNYLLNGVIKVVQQKTGKRLKNSESLRNEVHTIVEKNIHNPIFEKRLGNSDNVNIFVKEFHDQIIEEVVDVILNQTKSTPTDVQCKGKCIYKVFLTSNKNNPKTSFSINDKIKEITLNNINISLLNYNVTEDCNEFRINNKNFKIPPGNYKNISEVVVAVNKQLKGECLVSVCPQTLRTTIEMGASGTVSSIHDVKKTLSVDLIDDKSFLKSILGFKDAVILSGSRKYTSDSHCYLRKLNVIFFTLSFPSVGYSMTEKIVLNLNDEINYINHACDATFTRQKLCFLQEVFIDDAVVKITDIDGCELSSDTILEFCIELLLC